MTTGHSDSTELQENQDRPTYHKLPSDEDNEKAINASKHRLSVEVELNKGTKESSTDDDSLKDNPLIANGEHGGSVKKLDGSKTSINGELAGKKLEDDDDQGEEGDQDSFMFGMSKLRTFFFFLSLALLVAFVLVFVFVLPCSQSAQMDHRTNHITQQAVAGLTSKTGDMDGDGVPDMVYFKNNAPASDTNTNQRARRDADGDSSQTSSADCIVDGNVQPCAGQIVIVSTKLGSPIATRSVALIPQLPDDSAVLGKASAIHCASGGDRKKMACVLHSDGKYYVIDMKPAEGKAKSNLTSFATDGCSQVSMVPVSAKDASSFGFIMACKSVEGLVFKFVEGSTLKLGDETLLTYSAPLQPIKTASLKLTDDAGRKARVLVTLLKNGGGGGDSVRLSMQRVSSLLPSDVVSAKISTNVGTLLGNESALNVDIAGLDALKTWDMVFVDNEVVFFSDSDVAVPRKDKQQAQLTLQGQIKSVAPSSQSLKPVDSLVVKACSSSSSALKCSFQLASVAAEEGADAAISVSRKSLELPSMHDLPVSFIPGPRHSYFTSWYFQEVHVKEDESPEAETEASEDVGKKESSEDNVVKSDEDDKGEEETVAENEKVKRRSAEEEEEKKQCEPKWEATLIAYSRKSFSNPMRLYTALLCEEHSVSFIGLTVASGDAMYSLSVNKGPLSSVLTIDLPEGKVVTASGGQKSGFLWEDLKE